MKYLPLFVFVLALSACGMSMPDIKMPHISLPTLSSTKPPPETPAQVAERIKPLLEVLDVKSTALHAFNVNFRYKGKKALKRLVLETHYQGADFVAYMEGPIYSGSEFVARFKDSRIDTYRMNFAGLSWSVKEAIEDEAGVLKNDGGSLKPRSNVR